MRLTLRQMMAWAVTVCLAASIGATEVRADASAMEEVLGILRREGTIDEATQQRLLAKHATEQKNAAKDAAAVLGGFEWSGDLRLRYQGEFFGDSTRPDLGDQDDRYRLRYRARFGFKKKVTDRLKIGARLASGGGDRDSTNQTLGTGDFAGNDIFIDRAWADLALVDQDSFGLNLVGGRVDNPYTWGAGKDFLVWDGDINLTGGDVRMRFMPMEKSEVFFNLGTYIMMEDSDETDTKLIAGQLGFMSNGGPVGFGVRTSLYEYRSLGSNSDAFIRGDTRNDGNLVGNFVMGSTTELANDGGAFDDGRARVWDFSGFAKLGNDTALPITVYATYARNLEADSFDFIAPAGPMAGTLVPVDDEDTAWGLGFEVGDKKKNVFFGAGYFSVEANSVVATFTDSDLFDGFTNREGFIVYATRQVAKNVDFKLTYFDSDEIEDSGDFLGANGPFFRSLINADRRLLQADIEMKF
jgi:hypothetical protein